MTIDEIKKLIKDNIVSIYNDIYTIIDSYNATYKPTAICKYYDGIIVKLEYKTFYDSVSDCTYIINMFDMRINIYKYPFKAYFRIDTHYNHLGNYMKYSIDEILLQLENIIGD